MKGIFNGKLKIVIAFGILFLVVSILLTLIFFESKKSYTVKFDLNGGILLSGSLEQRVLQGQDAIPPSTVKDGAYLRGWSTSYQRVTKDLVVTAIWEYETTVGIAYADSSNQNYAELARVYPYLRGEIYLGAYYNNKKVLGILDGAFKDCDGITKVYLLNGLIKIGNNVFENCTSLEEIEIPETVTHLCDYVFKNCTSLKALTLHEGLLEIGDYAFENCESLEEITIPASVRHLGANAFVGCENITKITISEGLTYIGENAFEGCEKLEEIIIPASVTHIGENAFEGCENLVIKVSIPEDEWPEGWADGWFGDATVEFMETDNAEEGTSAEDTSDEVTSDEDESEEITFEEGLTTEETIGEE